MTNSIVDSTFSGDAERIERADAVVESIVAAVAAAADDGDGADGPTATLADRPPLYGAVDTDALSALVAHARDHTESVDWDLWFRYADHDVGVSSDGRVWVAAAASAERGRRPSRVDGRCPECDEATAAGPVEDDVVALRIACSACGHEWTASA